MGVDILVSHSPLGFKPGCVGYRHDIYGTAEGAKCIADFLGSGFNVGQCIADGFPYTITYPLQK